MRAALLRFTVCALVISGTPASLSRAQGPLPDHVMEQRLLESSGSRQLHDELQSAANYWYESRNRSNLPAMDEALAKVLPEALKEAPLIKDFQSWEEAHKFKAYHDAGAVLLAKSYTLLYYGYVDQARASIDLLTQKLPFSMTLADNRYFLWTRSALRYHEHMCAMYAAIVGYRKKTVAFPPERDEFDGFAQRQACRHMAILRLKEGNYDAVERFADMADSQHLCTSSGDWVINLIYGAMQPVEAERHSDAAWREVADAIRVWKQKFPRSNYARLAEANFLYQWAAHAVQTYGARGYEDFRERSDKGRSIVEDLKPDSPAWYSTTILLMAQTGAKLLDIAKVFRDGNEAYPDYAPLYRDLCVGFARSGNDGGVACAGVIHHLVGDGHPEQAARVLWRLNDTGDLATVQARLDIDDVRAAVAAALVKWPDSLELRSYMAFVAITLHQKDMARTAMQGMAGKWDRTAWKGREDLARDLCEAKAGAQAPLATPLPMAKP